ncbi:phage tail assembly chaperone GT [Virgibacillus pantothenticus]
MDLTEEGKDINKVLAMPYQFIIELLYERNKPKQEKSLIAAFGG